MGTGKLVRYDLERGTAEEHSFGTARRRANCPAGICPMFTTRSGTAAT